MGMRTENYLRESIFILFVHKGMIIWTTLSVFAAAALLAFYWPATFSATSAVLVKSKQPDKSPEALETNVPRRFAEITKADLASEVEMLTSPAVIRGTLAELRKRNPEFYGTADAARGNDDAQVYAVLRHLKTEIVPLSNVVSVTYFDKDAKRAVETLDALLTSYLAKRAEIYNVGGTAVTFFEGQSTTFRKRLDENQEAVIKTLDDTGVADPERELKNNLELKLAAETSLTRLHNEYLDAQAKHRRIQEGVNAPGIQYFSYLDSFVIVELAKKLTELYSERNRALETYHPESDNVKYIDEQLDKTAAALKAEAAEYMRNIGEKLRATETQMADLKRQIAGYDQQNLALRKQILSMSRLDSEAQLLRFNYETYSRRAQEESVDGSLSAAGISTRINVLNKAFPSNGPVYPRPATVLPLSILVGLILGVSLAFVREYFDHTFKKPSDVLDNIGLPVIFSLSQPVDPVAEARARKRIVVAVVTLLSLSAIHYLIWLYRYFV
jgi:uncharacterized protein involved in exopolysaccharide biosynthesis